MLFICPSESNNATGEALPAQKKARLHRVTDKTDLKFTVEAGNLVEKGMVFDPKSGSYCSGSVTLQTADVSDVSVCELGINYCPPDGRVLGRRRLILIFSSEHLKWFSLFRERPGQQSIDTPLPYVSDEIRDNNAVGPTTEADISALCGKWHVQRSIFDVHDGKVLSRTDAYTESRMLNGHSMTFQNDGDTGSANGEVSSDGRFMVILVEGRAARRMVILPGGVSVVYSVAVPKHDEDFYTELAWFVGPDERHVVCRRFEGSTWSGVTFSVEKRLT